MAIGIILGILFGIGFMVSFIFMGVSMYQTYASLPEDRWGNKVTAAKKT